MVKTSLEQHLFCLQVGAPWLENGDSGPARWHGPWRNPFATLRVPYCTCVPPPNGDDWHPCTFSCYTNAGSKDPKLRALAEGSFDEVQALFTEPRDLLRWEVDNVTSGHMGSLHIAFKRGDVDILKHLLQLSPKHFMQMITMSSGYRCYGSRACTTPLKQALLSKRSGVVQWMCESGVMTDSVFAACEYECNDESGGLSAPPLTALDVAKVIEGKHITKHFWTKAGIDKLISEGILQETGILCAQVAAVQDHHHSKAFACRTIMAGVGDIGEEAPDLVGALAVLSKFKDDGFEDTKDADCCRQACKVLVESGAAASEASQVLMRMLSNHTNYNEQLYRSLLAAFLVIDSDTAVPFLNSLLSIPSEEDVKGGKGKGKGKGYGDDDDDEEDNGKGKGKGKLGSIPNKKRRRDLVVEALASAYGASADEDALKILLGNWDYQVRLDAAFALLQTKAADAGVEYVRELIMDQPDDLDNVSDSVANAGPKAAPLVGFLADLISDPSFNSYFRFLAIMVRRIGQPNLVFKIATVASVVFDDQLSALLDAGIAKSREQIIAECWIEPDQAVNPGSKCRELLEDWQACPQEERDARTEQCFTALLGGAQ